MAKRNNRDCNVQLMEDVVDITKETPKTIKEVLKFTTDFIKDVIQEGAFESVLIPYFGKFKPKEKEIQWRSFYKGVTMGGTIEEINNQQNNTDGTI